MDTNKDGFVVVDEFSRKMKEIAGEKISKDEIDKFFNYMDQEKLGMVDLK
jgi:Ca2+-binding EF-hand superfamily protein